MLPGKTLTLREVAKLLRVHPVSVYRLIKTAKLPVFRIGRALRFDQTEVERWMKSWKRNAPAINGRRKRKENNS